MPRYENTGSHQLRFQTGPEPMPGETFEHEIPPELEAFLLKIHAIRRFNDAPPAMPVSPKQVKE